MIVNVYQAMLCNNKSNCNCNECDSKQGLFSYHKKIIVAALQDAANSFFVNDLYYNNCVYPKHIVETIVSYFIFYTDSYWSTLQKQVTLSKNKRSITVLKLDTTNDDLFKKSPLLQKYRSHPNHMYSVIHEIIAGMELGTAVVCNTDYSDTIFNNADYGGHITNYQENELLINEFNECYIFEFKYIAGSRMDVIVGVIDSNFVLNDNFTKRSYGVASDSNSFNYGLRYDNTICYNRDYKNWGKIDKYNTLLFLKTKNKDKEIINQDETNMYADLERSRGKWEDGDLITMKINTFVDKMTNATFAISFWINQEKIFYDPNVMSRALYGQIKFPLRVAASCARGGGLEILRSFRLME